MVGHQLGEDVSSQVQVGSLIKDVNGLLADAKRNYEGPGKGKVEELYARCRAVISKTPDNWMRDRLIELGTEPIVKEFLDDHDLVRAILKGLWGWTDDDVKRYAENRQSQRPLGEGFKVEYLKPEDRERLLKQHAIRLDGPLRLGDSPQEFDTSTMVSKASGPGWAIFVMDGDGNIFAGQHKVGLFHHSSFLGGGAVAAAGEMKVEKGRLVAVTAKSGHYWPTPEHTRQLLRELAANGVQLKGVEVKSWEQLPNGMTVTRIYDAHDFLEKGTSAHVVRAEKMF
jgi:hypothetical protein